VTHRADQDAEGMEDAQPSNSQLYPWYDSDWLSKYEEAKAIIRSVRPDALPAFVDSFRISHTRADFKVKFLEQPFMLGRAHRPGRRSALLPGCEKAVELLAHDGREVMPVPRIPLAADPALGAVDVRGRRGQRPMPTLRAEGFQ